MPSLTTPKGVVRLCERKAFFVPQNKNDKKNNQFNDFNTIVC